jgi:hypothetical protein
MHASTGQGQDGFTSQISVEISVVSRIPKITESHPEFLNPEVWMSKL